MPKFETLIQEEKAVSVMGKFARRLHLLANFGIDANKALLAYKESVAEGKNPYAFKNDGDSGSFRL
ncbi:hypothetical protein DPMN_079733 [Dreissena polymorpha]|uniref:Uncharacterized protein n=1 Tax=Dreissena polymorpha TaxID=45954 RepID=A0A9D4BQC7_DREPO|nr:hypothetical protein DPMN_079733 [Dreissena polymorpha]